MELLIILIFILISYTRTGNDDMKKTLAKLPVGKNAGNRFDDTAFTEIALTLKENKR